MNASEHQLRETIVDVAHSLYARRLTHGSTGNISVRLDENILVTGTGTNLGNVRADQLSTIDMSGAHIAGPPPSKEAFLHAALLRARPHDNAVVHTHSTYAAAVSCLADVNDEDVLPALTAYFAMRVGTLPLLPYFAPGDVRLREVAEHMALTHNALLLRNHGPIAAARSLSAAVDAIEEVEETAHLFLLLRGQATNSLTVEQRNSLRN